MEESFEKAKIGKFEKNTIDEFFQYMKEIYDAHEETETEEDRKKVNEDLKNIFLNKYKDVFREDEFQWFDLHDDMVCFFSIFK